MQSKTSNRNAIILNRINYKDADKIITLYTDKLGKIRALAKGVRKMNSHRRGKLEMFNLVRAEFIKYTEWYIITQTDLLKSYSKIKSDPTRINVAYYIAETFDKLVPLETEDQTLFAFLCKTFDYLEICDPIDLLNAYNIKILRILGFWDEKHLENFSEDEKSYLINLLTKKYEEIFLPSEINEPQTKTEAEMISTSVNRKLRVLTEETLEQKIKTQILYQS